MRCTVLLLTSDPQASREKWEVAFGGAAVQPCTDMAALNAAMRAAATHYCLVWSDALEPPKDLLPQLVDTEHPSPAERGPGLSARRAGRLALRQRLLTFFPQAGEAAPPPPDWLPLEVGPELLESLEARHILLEDVREAVTRVERHQAYFVNEGNGHRLGSWRPRRVTFWVEYTEADGRCVLHGAWCHRMHVPGSGCVDEPDGAPAMCCGR